MIVCEAQECEMNVETHWTGVSRPMKLQLMNIAGSDDTASLERTIFFSRPLRMSPGQEKTMPEDIIACSHNEEWVTIWYRT